MLSLPSTTTAEDESGLLSKLKNLAQEYGLDKYIPRTFGSRIPVECLCFTVLCFPPVLLSRHPLAPSSPFPQIKLMHFGCRLAQHISGTSVGQSDPWIRTAEKCSVACTGVCTLISCLLALRSAGSSAPVRSWHGPMFSCSYSRAHIFIFESSSLESVAGTSIFSPVYGASGKCILSRNRTPDFHH